MAINLLEGKNHLIIKRNGKEEQFSWSKLDKVLLWAITYNTGILRQNAQGYLDTIKANLTIRISDRIHITKLYDELIDVTANLVSRLYPKYDLIARNLYLQKLYKDIWQIKRNEYPEYKNVIEKGIKYKVYNHDIFSTFSEEELQQLANFIQPERDFLFTFAGLTLFVTKYLAKYTKHKYLELPQHRFMAVALQLHYKDKNRMELIKQRYDMMSLQQIATATPIMLNSLSNVFNPTSCVLIETADDTESIMESARSIALYSKHASGVGLNASAIRCKGSLIGNKGISSGVVPFAKVFESIISAWNQQNKRPGSLAFYYPWWHYDAPDIIMLKDAGGNEDNRARKLKYAIISNRYFLEAVKQGKDVYLFDPKETPKLLDSYGSDFEKWYEFYSNKQGIKKKTINARELFYLYSKVYVETGNNYYFSKDNANKFNMAKDTIRQGNLCCCEVMIPTKPLKVISNKLIYDYNSKETKEIRELSGEIGICNLTSINLLSWDSMTDTQKDNFCYTLLVGMDNSIEYADYPVKAGELSNKSHRAIGVGITNYHNWLATHKLKFTDEESLKLTHEVMEDILYFVLKNSNRLAKEKGTYKYFKGSMWEQGILPFELYENYFKENNLPFNFPYKHDWRELKESIKQYGVRFEYHLSIPPGATSSAVFNMTEGIEPIRDFVIKKEGTYNITSVAPNLRNNTKYYELSWDIPMSNILKLAAVRQKFLDQGQSLNVYLANPNSALELFNLIYTAELYGIKSLYYLNSLKKEEIEECESCAV